MSGDALYGVPGNSALLFPSPLQLGVLLVSYVQLIASCRLIAVFPGNLSQVDLL